MSATYFETVQRQVRQQDRRIERSTSQNAQVATRGLSPGIGLFFGAAASLAMWLVIAKVALSLIG
jgi:tetrahydromethanopterin S-methyltransferase subunit G